MLSLCQVFFLLFSDLSLAGQLGLTAMAGTPGMATTPLAAGGVAGQGYIQAASPTAAPLAAAAAAGGKARSSMNLSMISGR